MACSAGTLPQLAGILYTAAPMGKSRHAERLLAKLLECHLIKVPVGCPGLDSASGMIQTDGILFAVRR